MKCFSCARREQFVLGWCLHKHSGSDGEKEIAAVPGDRRWSRGQSALIHAPRQQ
jgi:hypothetical protein